MLKVIIKKDELFSSYLFRLAKRNYTNVSTILYYIFKKHQLFAKDLDLYSFTKIEKRKIKSIMSVNLNKHQLFQYDTYIEEQISNHGRHIWLTTGNRSPYYKKFYGIRFCPICLREHGYFKIQWRLMFINICEEHNCFLHNYCEKCSSKIIYSHNDYLNEIYECFKCKFDLRKSEIAFISKNSKYKKEQSFLKNIAKKGYYKIEHKCGYSFQLFSLIRFLITVLLRIDKRNIIYIEQLTPIELANYISRSLFLLKNFPNRINKFLVKNKLTNGSFIFSRHRKKLSILPNWFINGLTYNKRTFNGQNFK